MQFTGVVKTSTRRFPMKTLSEVEFENPGEFVSMKAEKDGIQFCAVAWLDHERRYFISTTGTTNPGSPIVRNKWREIAGEARRIVTETECPEMIQDYYSVCSRIDRHNRCRQDDLRMEKKIETKDWSFRVNCSLLSICVVDAWLLFMGINGDRTRMKQADFYASLAESLIDNPYDQRVTERQPDIDTDEEELMEARLSGIGMYLVSSNRKRKNLDGSSTNMVLQNRCSMCSVKKNEVCVLWM